ncbi:hypothetical protein MCOR27_009027 [Pyricularia oryzae]|uniref:Acetylxylan esterase 2 n=2 Tax=Pyricularia TaxID=48558 RepID=A0ABQ8NAM2_PYRGI|nr:hypothetical protein MCOR01_003686 [Pyricularia oryzae]KAI6294063.1 hypothetical protein MCOR33_008730 [Pyricularia grisea]KAH9431989.1 hypothetical protein MCOR02_006694 [Pyricularia oryzae]KAI6262395.1 hypothetical protein MCOR19_001432 [Pyricularia oryzae]KAI6271001.1 hypothetical protein MCOR27_009027 [Pyricularia oryzae]
MVSALPIAGLLVAAVAAQTPDASLAPPTSCAPGVQIFAARGTTEAPGVGKIQTVAGNVTAAIPGSAVTAVDYPATFDDYAQSVATGSSDLGQLVKDYVKMCPDSKIALLGYSQGAQAVADLICGASSELMPVKTADLDSIYDKNIIAMILFGDPTRAANQSFNLGTVTDRDGLFPRLKNDACEPYSPRLRSWCDVADRYCDPSAPGGIDTTVHGTYFNKYTQAAKDFIVEQWQLSQKSLPPRSSIGSAQPTGTANGTHPANPTGAPVPTSTTPVAAGASRTGAAAFGAILMAGVAAFLA